MSSRATVRLALALGLAVATAGCAVHAPSLDAAHPATASAPAGRLAPAPPSLRTGVIAYPDVPAIRTAPPAPHHNHAP